MALSGFYLSLFLYYYPLLVSLTCLGFLQLPHKNSFTSFRFGFFDDFGIVYIDLVVVLLLINFLYITLLSFAFIIFPQDFNLIFQTNCKSYKKYFM